MNWQSPTRDELLALEGKYAQLETLRRAREKGEPVPERAVFKALAERFPGALRELDMLPMDVIEKRRQALGMAITSGLVEPWMSWMVAYHALVRVALWIKIRTAKQPDVTPERMVFLTQTITREFGFGVDEAFVKDVARPREGRINAVVLGKLEELFAVSAGEIRMGLFGRRG